MKTSLVALLAAASQASAFTVLVDYTFDTNNFFDTPLKRDAMQAAADRFSNIMTSTLLAIDATYMGGSTSWRVGFTHPGTGASFEISTAPNQTADLITQIGGQPADRYDPTFRLPANTWRLFAGGRSGLGSAGVGGTGTGTNVTSVFDDPNGPLHRGAIPNTPGAATFNDLPAWGGGISFESSVNWHFGISTAAPAGTTDFYSIALHEVGHALGLSTNWNQWQTSGGLYTGAQAVAAFNADNGTVRTSLNEVSASDPHWQDNTYDSFIFTLGGPNLAGTRGLNTLQDLLMEPVANFVNPTQTRFELTNVDVAALRDISWTTVPEPGTASMVMIGAAFLARRRRRSAR